MKAAMAVLLLGAAFMPPAVHAEAGHKEGSAAVPLSKGEIKAQQQFRMLDFNRDGKLSRGEVALVPKLAAAFDETDTNKDGYVTYEEVRAFAVKYRAAQEKAKAAEAARQAPSAINSEASAAR
jgi:Ca2+-binding EF-hand superfamily protein